MTVQRVCLVWTLIAGSLLASSPAPAVEAQERACVPGRLIVGFRDAVAPVARHAVHANAGVLAIKPLLHPRMDLVTVDPSADLHAVEAAYRARPEVAFAQPDYLGQGGFVPNDTFYGEQWHHANTGQSGGTPGADIESEGGWDISRGSNAVVVAVLDTGIDSDHPEFAGRILPGWDFVNDDADPEDDHGHGTLVTGLLAANAGNGFAVAGTDHECMILPVKVLDSFNIGTTSNLINALGFGTTNAVDVISMSLVNYPCSTALDDALRDAKLAGAILVACAGNGGIGDADASCPGASFHSLSIGTTMDNDARASYSATGNALGFVAPGHLVRSVVFDSFADEFSIFSGCSAATPVAAGIVSILRALDPSLRTPHIRAILQASAEDMVGDPTEDTPGWDPYMGYGRLNLRAALEQFLQNTGAPRLAETDDLHLETSPNPAAGAATVRFTLPAPAWVTLTIYDVRGRIVRTMLDGISSGGAHDVRWDGLDGEGRRVGSGVYFARLATSGRATQKKITLLRW